MADDKATENRDGSLSVVVSGKTTVFGARRVRETNEFLARRASAPTPEPGGHYCASCGHPCDPRDEYCYPCGRLKALGWI